MRNFAIGVDIGGSHVTCRLIDLSSHQFVEGAYSRMAVDSQGSADDILHTWAVAIRESCRSFSLPELAGIGFAMPGPFDYPGGVAWFRNVKKFDALYGMNIRSEMQNRLGLPAVFPVRFLNDAACFAIGESYQGEAALHPRILAITLGTGFGTTFLDNHLPVAGQYGIPGDGFLYRVPFQDSVADDYFSTRWFLKEYEAVTGMNATGVKALADRAASDAAIAALFNTFGNNLGIFLVPWLENFKAGCLVIGGNISASYPLFKDELLRIFRENGLTVSVTISSLGEDAALSGSASLCDNDFYTSLTA